MDISFKRIVAYLIDFFIVSLVASMLVTISGYNTTNNENKYESYEKVIADYNDKKITDAEYEKATIDFNYDMSKDSAVINVVTIILIIGYFGIYQVMAKGQTIGKKLLKIKIVQKDDSPLTYFSAIIRTIILTNVLFRIMLIVGLYFLNANKYYSYSYVISMIQGAIQIIIFIMVILRQDGRGLHDILAKTKVIASEVKNEVKLEENIKEEKPKQVKKTIEVAEKPKRKTPTKAKKTKSTKNTKE